MPSNARDCDPSSIGAVKLICFDLGGVIVRICRTWEEGCRQAGLPVRGTSADPAMKEIRRSITSEYTVGRVGGPEWAQRITEALDGLYTREEILKIHHAWLIDEYPDWGGLVEAIHAAGLSTACLSNTNDSHWKRMHQDFPTILSLRIRHASHLLRCAKPDPAIYQAFERETGYRGREIVFFDDLPENVEAAREAGWHAVRIDHTTATAPQVGRALQEFGILPA